MGNIRQFLVAKLMILEVDSKNNLCGISTYGNEKVTYDDDLKKVIKTEEVGKISRVSKEKYDFINKYLTKAD